MANPLHSQQTVDDGIHIVQSVEVADAAARAAYSASTVAADVGRYVRQADTGFFYMVQVAGAPDLVQVVPPPGGPPSGTAGGDLFGTYPNPQVIALQTTAGGGTQLSIGNIPDTQLLARSGTSIVGVTPPSAPIGNHYTYAEDYGQSTSTGPTYANKVTLTTPNIPGGAYRISWTYTYGASNTNQDFQARIMEDGVTEIWNSRIENKDSGTNQQAPAGGPFRRRVLSAGVHTFALEYRGTTFGTTARIAQAAIEFWQVP